MRASVVNAAALAEVADELELGDALLLGKGEDASGGREKPSILADAMEAVIGAVYLDGGLGRRRDRSSCGLLGDRIDRSRRRPGRPGLQDAAAGARRPSVRRSCRATRSATRARPRQALLRPVLVGGVARGQGEGRSKKQAEQAAAATRGTGWPRWSRRSRPSPPRRTPRGMPRAEGDPAGGAAGAERIGGSGPNGSGATSAPVAGSVPELPEVEIVRRDLSAEVSARRSTRSR